MSGQAGHIGNSRDMTGSVCTSVARSGRVWRKHFVMPVPRMKRLLVDLPCTNWHNNNYPAKYWKMYKDLEVQQSKSVDRACCCRRKIAALSNGNNSNVLSEGAGNIVFSLSAGMLPSTGMLASAPMS